jgi:osmotically-inducible protein OsmY
VQGIDPVPDVEGDDHGRRAVDPADPAGDPVRGVVVQQPPGRRRVADRGRPDELAAGDHRHEEIRREITQDVIADGFFTDPDRLAVTVKDGIVTLAGAPGSVILGRNIADQARHVEGVVAVRDRFTHPAPPAHSASPVPSDPGR